MPHHLQPFLHELVTTLAAPTQVLSGRDGDVVWNRDSPSAQGVIHADVRVLSEAVLTVNGTRPAHIATVDAEDAEDPTDLGAGTTFVSLIRDLGPEVAVVPDPQLRLDRRRSVSPGRLSETLSFRSATQASLRLSVRLSLRSDYASIDSIKSGMPAQPQRLQPARRDDIWSWSATDLQLRLTAAGAELELHEEQTRAELGWEIVVPPMGRAAVEWALEVEDQGAAVVAAAGEPLAVPELVARLVPDAQASQDARLRPWLRRSLADLNSLRMATPDSPDDAFFAAGSPWYLTLFGRDSLWAARLLLPVDVRHAGSTLRTLAARQGVRTDPEAAEQPGKILHELRRGQFSFGDSSLPPVYFGTVDATMLWICLLHDAWRAGLPDDEVRALLPACQAALAWLTDHADADGDGFVEYVDESGHGLANQGWKDSGDSIRFADGTIATGAVALVEVQGYAYEAARAGADLLDGFGLAGGDALRRWAMALADRFRGAFWCGTGPDRFPALALDGEKRRVDSVTSNIGHLLGTGILDAEEELLVARRLAAVDMDSGLGLRTMSSAAGGYQPLSYHCGSVWPHDTAIVVAGLTRAGLLSEAPGLVEGLLQASLVFGGRLPELWSGEGTSGVPYPASCRPQAWSAAAAVTVAAALGQAGR